MAKQTKAEIAKEADKALTQFLKKNELKRDKDYSKDAKFGKKFKELTLALQKANDDLAGGEAKAKDSKKAGKTDKAKKESKGSPGRATKYEYPEGLTAEEKKEFRVQARKAAKNGGKVEAKAKVEKTTKTTKKVDAKETKGKDKKKKKKSSKND
jgi:hypothetical protein